MEKLIRKIIKEEVSNRRQEKLMGLIKDYGVDQASKAVGGIDNLFKILDINSPMDFLHLFNGLEQVQSEEKKDWTLFRYKPRHNFMFYDRKNKKVYISYRDMWVFLKENFGLTRSEIKTLTKEWLRKDYNLRGIRTEGFQGIGTIML
jgi:hypothetical protein